MAKTRRTTCNPVLKAGFWPHDAAPPREKDQKVEPSDDRHAANDGHTHEVHVDAANHLPPHVKLVSIMKD